MAPLQPFKRGCSTQGDQHKVDETEAIVYKIEVSSGWLFQSHGMGKQIIEIFIPSEELIFNIGDGGLNVFKSDSGRRKGSGILIPTSFVKSLRELVNRRENCREEAKKHLEISIP